MVGGTLGLAGELGAGAGLMATIGGGLSGVGNILGQAQDIGKPDYGGINVGSLAGAVIGGALGGAYGGALSGAIVSKLGGGVLAKTAGELTNDALSGGLDPIGGALAKKTKEGCQ